MLDLSRTDDVTGEIIEARPKCLFRSLTDLKQYKDGETYEPDTSMIDTTGYEPLASIVARCMRTMKTPGGQIISVLDKQALKSEETQTGIYEASGATSIDEAFETEDPTESPEFDLSDAAYLMQAANQNIAASEVPSDHDESRSGTSEASSEEEVKEELANG